MIPSFKKNRFLCNMTLTKLEQKVYDYSLKKEFL